MKTFLFFSISFFLSLTSTSQNLIGTWKGDIVINGNQLPIVFHFYKDSSGKLEGKWDSPKQNATGLGFSAIDIDNDSLHVGIKMIGGSYSGKFITTDSVSGKWHQAGASMPLNFSRSDNTEATEKEVVHPFEKEIVITSANQTQLYGTLLSKNNQQKLAIIIAGSGPTDREGNNRLGVDANSYKLLAYALDTQNIASFRYDKRGIAKSTVANFQESDLLFSDYVKDAEKIFDYLHDSLGFKDIYFIGHSEGSLVGMIASQKKKVKGFISVAGAGRPINVLIEQQINKQPLPDSLKNKVHYILSELKKGNEVADIPASLLSLFRKSVQPYMISWLKYSPEQEIKKLHCPILILQGSCDIQVKTADAYNLYNANKKSILDIIPAMTHTLKDASQNCENQTQTYTDRFLPLNKTLVKDIAGFIRK